MSQCRINAAPIHNAPRKRRDCSELVAGARGALASVAITLTCGVLQAGCTATQAKEAENAARIAATVACIVAHAFLPDESAIATACAIEPELYYLIRPTATETKTTVALAVARRDGARGK